MQKESLPFMPSEIEEIESIRKHLRRELRKQRWQVWAICSIFLVLFLAVVIGALLLIPPTSIELVQGATVPPGAGEADFMKLFLSVFVVAFGFIVGMLGLKRLEQFDKEIEALRTSTGGTLIEERKFLAEENKATREQIDKRFSEVRQDVQSLVERYASNLLSARQKDLENFLTAAEMRARNMIASVRNELQPYEWLASKQDRLRHFTDILTMGIAHSRVTALYADGKEDAAIEVARYAVNNTLPGSTDDFHNLSSELARNDQDTLAADVIRVGLALYPRDVDLLADGIKCYSVIGNLKESENHLATLRKVNYALWNWRAFVFAGDFLELTERPEEAMDIYSQFRINLPDDERGYSQPGIYYRKLGKFAPAVEILEAGIAACRRCSQTAFSLSEIYIEQGEYEKAILATNRALESNADEQPSVNQSAVLWNRAIAQDALLHRKLSDPGTVIGDDIIQLAACTVVDYRTALSMKDAIHEFRVRGPQRIQIMKGLLKRHGLEEDSIMHLVGTEPLPESNNIQEILEALNQNKDDADEEEPNGSDQPTNGCTSTAHNMCAEGEP